MSMRLFASVVLFVAGSCPVLVSAQTLQGTAFTYQGELTRNGVAVDGSVDLVFELFDAPTGGSPIGAPLPFTTANGNPAVVSGGIFSVALDFGAAAFAGPVANARWLRVTVDGNVLAPRTKVESAPYALLARNAELAFAVPDASIGAAEVVPAQIQLRGLATSCASGEFMFAIGADGNVECAADVSGPTPQYDFGILTVETGGVLSVSVDTAQVQARGSSTQCASGEVVSGIEANGNVNCATDADSGGDITGVTAGSGLTGGGAAGSVVLSADPNVVQSRVTATCPPESSIRAIDASGAVTCEGDSIGTGWGLSGNAGTTPAANYIGTSDNQALEFRVQNARAMRLEPTADTASSGQVNVIGGAAVNAVTAGARGATVAGGGSGDSNGPNRVTDNFGVVGGGVNNRAGNDTGTTSDASAATIGGGVNNLATAVYATVSGGVDNLASGIYASVAGGTSNVASGQAAFAAGNSNRALGFGAAAIGGSANEAFGVDAVVAGGSNNNAGGDRSFVAGVNGVVRTSDEGTVLFAGSHLPLFISDGPNRFLARATGGVRFVTGIDGAGAATSGVQLASGSGAWSSLSDRSAKTDFASVDPLGVLERVLALPISRWRYRAQDASVRHLGPMAQDFHAAFGLGSDERHITTVDADGVSLAAIQGLNAKLEAEVDVLQAANARLAQANARLAREQAALAARLAAIEASMRTADTRR